MLQYECNTSFLGGIAESNNVTYCEACGLSVCVSVTLLHPTKAFGRNEMPFGRDMCGPK